MCPLECTQINYEIKKDEIKASIKSVHRARKGLLENLNITIRPDTVHDIESRFMDIYIFFEHTKHTVISEIAKISFTDLISGLGGLLGLFMGLSLLSLVEVIDILLKVLRIKWS